MTLDLDTIEAKIHDEPAGPLTGIALALVAEVRRLRAEISGEPVPDGMVFRPHPLPEEGERDLPVKGQKGGDAKQARR